MSATQVVPGIVVLTFSGALDQLVPLNPADWTVVGETAIGSFRTMNLVSVTYNAANEVRFDGTLPLPAVGAPKRVTYTGSPTGLIGANGAPVADFANFPF